MKISTLFLICYLMITSLSQYSPVIDCPFKNFVSSTQEIIQIHPHTFNGVLNAFILTKQSTTLLIHRKEIIDCVFTAGVSTSITVDNFDDIHFQINGFTASVLYLKNGVYKRKIFNPRFLTQNSVASYPHFFKGVYLNKYDFQFYYDASGNESLYSQYKEEPVDNIYSQFYESLNLQNMKFKMNKQKNILVIQERLTTKIRFKKLQSSTQIISDLGVNSSINAPLPIECFCIDDSNVGYFLLNNGQLSSYNITTCALLNSSLVSGLSTNVELVYDSYTNSIFTFNIVTNTSTEIGQFKLTSGEYLPLVKRFNRMNGVKIDTQRKFYAVWNTLTPSFRIISNNNTVTCLENQFYNTRQYQCQNITLQKEYNYQDYDDYIDFLQVAFQNPLMSFFNRIPGGRKVVKFFFFFFTNFDDLWLFQYHSRNYGKTMNALFEHINNLEKQKWEMVKADTMRKGLEQVSVKEKSVIQYLDNRTAYSSEKFVETEQRGEGFLANSWFYLTINTFFVLLTFFVLRRLFFLTFNWRFSVAFRPFSFWSYLILMLLDGNVQYFYFLFFNQAKLGFSFSFHEKMVHLLTYFLFFVFLLVSISSYFIYYQIYKRLAKYFFDQAKTNIKGAIILCITNTLRNLILGAIHNFLRTEMELQLLSLGVIEVFFILVVIVSMSIRNIFVDYLSSWINIFFSFLRIIIIVFLYVQQISQKDEIVLENIESSLQFLIKLYILMYLAGILIEFIKRSIEVAKNKGKNTSSDDDKKEENNKKDEVQDKEIYKDDIQGQNLQLHQVMVKKDKQINPIVKVSKTLKIVNLKEQQFEQQL